MSRLLPIFVLVLACQHDSDEPMESATESTIDLEDTAVTDLPDLDAEEVGALVADALAEGVLSCRDVVEAYDEVRQQGDDTGICPGGRPSNAESAVEDIDVLAGCTANSGYYFRGVANYAWRERGDLDAGTRSLLAGLWADLTVLDPDAARMDAAGECTYDVVEQLSPGQGTALAVDSVLLGAWLVPWADSGMSEKLSSIMDAHLVGPLTGPTLRLDGAYGVGERYLAFYDFTYNDVCTDGVAGALAMRGELGFWYDLDFGGDCDTCAEVSYHAGAHALGTLCIDEIDAIAEQTMLRLYPGLHGGTP